MAAERVASISQTCPACGASIDTTDAEPLARIACPNCGEKVRVERSFHNFVLLETLGVGGMGTVYKARDTVLDRLVALKLLRKDLGTEIDHATRFQREARAAASVNHPNVIQVFSSGTDHGQFYLVMELVDHGSLDDFTEQRKRLSEQQVLEVGIQVAKGLRAAHAKGLIHRDVKPANILFADEHTAKIGDFGLAGLAAEEAGNRDEIWGTPYYVAPERLNNEPEDFRSDIYSLGATLFHAVAGKAPIEGETSSATALRALKNKPLDLARVAPDISAATARVFHRMIAPHPTHRFSSYDELVGELEKAQRALTGSEDVALASAQQKRRGTNVIGGAIILVLIVISGFLFTSIPARQLERRYHEARRQLLAGNDNVAHAAFSRIAVDAKNRQPLHDWVCLHEGLAALIGREPSQARQAFQEVENAGQLGFAREDVDLAKFFVATAKAMSAPGTVPSRTRLNDDTFEAFGLLLFALKDIAQIDVNDAALLLEQFVKARPQGKFGWIADYKPLAQKYLDDSRLYAAWKHESKVMGSPAKSLERIRSIKQQLRIHSAISDEIREEEKTWSQRVAEEQKEDAAREREREKVREIEVASWNAALANYNKQIALYDFIGAGATIRNVQLGDPSLRQSQQVAQKKAQWLTDWKSKLIDDFNRAHFSGAIVDVRGVKYTGVAGATARHLAVKVPYGTVQVPWTKLAPKMLLAISSSFIQPTAPDAADRRWLCAVFANEIGQTNVARQLASAAAKSKAEYRDQIPLLFSQ